MLALTVSTDLPATRRRISRLRRYVNRTLLNETGFVCLHLAECKGSTLPSHQFREGTMSHVGRRFDLHLGDKALRIMVVGQESGLPKDPNSPWASNVNTEARYRQVHDRTGLQRRYYAEPGHQGRNPHMRGTTSALRTIFGLGQGLDHEDEFVQPVSGRPFDIFDGFALVNRLICSAGLMHSRQGRPTQTMFRNCSEHFTATTAILEPTLVILQGSSVAKWTSAVLEPGRSYGEHLYETYLNGRR
jgi:hypothetical protein